MEQKKYEIAHKKVEDVRSFYLHSIAFVVVNMMLIVINVKTYKQSESWWFIYPLIGWGIGLITQGLSISSRGPLGQKWKEKKFKHIWQKTVRVSVMSEHIKGNLARRTMTHFVKVNDRIKIV